MWKVPLTLDESELNASASAPCMPVLAFIASANNLASLAPEAEVSELKSDAKALNRLF